jgi:hypothetical protein
MVMKTVMEAFYGFNDCNTVKRSVIPGSHAPFKKTVTDNKINDIADAPPCRENKNDIDEIHAVTHALWAEE